MSVYEMARRYYPRLWSRDRIEALAAAGRLTEQEAEEIIKEDKLTKNKMLESSAAQ